MRRRSSTRTTYLLRLREQRRIERDGFCRENAEARPSFAVFDEHRFVRRHVNRNSLRQRRGAVVGELQPDDVPPVEPTPPDLVRTTRRKRRAVAIDKARQRLFEARRLLRDLAGHRSIL